MRNIFLEIKENNLLPCEKGAIQPIHMTSMDVYFCRRYISDYHIDSDNIHPMKETILPCMKDISQFNIIRFHVT